jgi:hypothetical protein
MLTLQEDMTISFMLSSTKDYPSAKILQHVQPEIQLKTAVCIGT